MSTATAPVFASAEEAMAMAHAGLAYIATADATAMSAAERARCLREMEQADAVATAARTSGLGAFAAGQDYADDGDYSACSWLIHRIQVTKGTAVDHTGWVKRGIGHPLVMAALAGKAVSKSYAREICWWTDRLPAESRQAADEILLGAAASGLELADLAGLAAEMYERSRQDKPDTDPGDDDEDGDDPATAFDDRAVKLSTTLGGAGIIRGALTPECAEFVQTVLDALSAPAGADDDRSHDQRYHDALQEAMRRLMAGGLVPQRSGAPLRVWAYISLADLMRLPGSADLVAQWAAQLHARWAGQRAAAAEQGGHQGLWLDGDAAKGIACGAPVTPVRTKTTTGTAPMTVTAAMRTAASRTRPPEPVRLTELVRLTALTGPGRLWRRRSSARRSSCCPDPAGSRRSSAVSSSTPGSAGPACRWTSATARPSRRVSATRSASAASTANGPAAASSLRERARSTTPATRPTAARPASETASSCAGTTTRW